MKWLLLLAGISCLLGMTTALLVTRPTPRLTYARDAAADAAIISAVVMRSTAPGSPKPIRCTLAKVLDTVHSPRPGTLIVVPGRLSHIRECPLITHDAPSGWREGFLSDVDAAGLKVFLPPMVGDPIALPLPRTGLLVWGQILAEPKALLVYGWRESPWTCHGLSDNMARQLESWSPVLLLGLVIAVLVVYTLLFIRVARRQSKERKI